MGDDRLDSHETITKIDGLTLEDNNLDGTSILPKIDNSIQEYNMHDSEQLEDSGSRSYPSNNVSNTVPPIFEVKESSTRGDSTTQSQEEKPVKRKPTVRAKVPFEKGYSQMDWLKLTRTAPDLAGLKGQSNRRLISIDEIRQHKTEGSAWTVLKGCVFNISPYMKFHPGGEDMLMKAAGKDCTSLFTADSPSVPWGQNPMVSCETMGTLLPSSRYGRQSNHIFIVQLCILNYCKDKYHAWVNAEFLLEKCLIGFLDASEQEISANR